MTGAYVKVRRNGRWDDVEIEYLTDEEFDEFARRLPAKGWVWVKFLVKWIRENVKSI